MPWIPSHTNIGSHPKTRRAARIAECSVPTMVGHLHLLWHWAMGVAPDGDLARFDAYDLAEAAMWAGDPEQFVRALRECGPGDSHGFLRDDGTLNDWAEYGGKCHAKSQAGKKAADARWAKQRAGKVNPPDLPLDATAMQTQCDRNADERRGEETRNPTTRSQAYPQRDADAPDAGEVEVEAAAQPELMPEPLTGPSTSRADDEQQFLRTARLIADAVAEANGARTGGYARQVANRICTGDAASDLAERRLIHDRLAAGETPEAIAASWPSQPNALAGPNRPTVAPYDRAAAEVAREAAYKREAATNARLEAMRENPGDAASGVAEARAALRSRPRAPS